MYDFYDTTPANKSFKNYLDKHIETADPYLFSKIAARCKPFTPMLAWSLRAHIVKINEQSYRLKDKLKQAQLINFLKLSLLSLNYLEGTFLFWYLILS